MKRRVFAALLTAVLLVSLLPVSPSASAAGATAAQIEQRIRSTYARSLRGAGRTSFNGWCGTAVSWQLMYLGVDAYVRGRDGKHEFDMYASMKVTTGGYRVTAYPASRYTLRQALDTITANGTRDVYNLLVGFETSTSAAGSIYGHALVIYAILGGRVYFGECYDVYINGKNYPEGSAVSCTIAEFCDYYNRGRTFDGVAYFGVKSYADLCTAHPANMYAMATTAMPVYTEPGDPGVHEPESVLTHTAEGQWVRVTGLFVTPQGKNWYQVEFGRGVGYVPAETLNPGECDFSDVMLSDLRLPVSAHVGSGFNIRGNVTTAHSMIRNVQVRVYTQDGSPEEPIMMASLDADARNVSLNQGAFNNVLTFRLLPVGTYRLSIRVTLENYVIENGQAVAIQKVEDIYHSEFFIVPDWGTYPAVFFNGNGGQPALNYQAYNPGQQLGALPEVTREGYTFLGWTTDPAGTTPPAEDMTINGDVTLYAQWQKNPSTESGWLQLDGVWTYCENGKPVKGWFTYDGLTFYQNVAGKPVSGWYQINSYYRPFSAAGALLTGWQVFDGKTYYIDSEGLKTRGWLTEGEKEYFFDQNGWRVLGWIYWNGNYRYLTKTGYPMKVELYVDGLHCSFDRNGNMQFAEQKGKDYYLVCDRQAAAKLENTERLLLA